MKTIAYMREKGSHAVTTCESGNLLDEGKKRSFRKKCLLSHG